MIDAARFRTFATELAQTVIAMIADTRTQFEVDVKADETLVTNIDIAIEQALRARIESRYPDHGIIGEELPARNPGAEWTWVIDPIDGTLHFAAGLPSYGSLVALCHRGVPKLGIICQPELSDIYLGLSGQGCWRNGVAANTAPVTLANSIVSISDPDGFDTATRAGMERLRGASRWNVFDGGCLSFAALATGRIGVSVYAPNVENVDICALVPVVEGAGGVITDWQGEPVTIDSKGEIVASASRPLHDEVLALLNR